MKKTYKLLWLVPNGYDVLSDTLQVTRAEYEELFDEEKIKKIFNQLSEEFEQWAGYSDHLKTTDPLFRESFNSWERVEIFKQALANRTADNKIFKSAIELFYDMKHSFCGVLKNLTNVYAPQTYLEILSRISFLIEEFENISYPIDFLSDQRRQIPQRITRKITDRILREEDFREELERVVASGVRKKFKEGLLNYSFPELLLDFSNFKENMLKEIKKGLVSINRKKIIEESKAINKEGLEDAKSVNELTKIKENKVLVRSLKETFRKMEEINSHFFINYKNEILPLSLNDYSVSELVSFFSASFINQFHFIREEYQKMCVGYQHLLKKSGRREREFEGQLDEYDELIKKIKLNSFNNYIFKLAEVDGKLINAQTRLEKYHKKFHKHKKANQLQHQLRTGEREAFQNYENTQLHFYSTQYPTEFAELEKNLIELNKIRELKGEPKKERIEISDLVSLLVKKNDKLKTNQTLLIKQALELSNKHTQSQQDADDWKEIASDLVKELTQKNQNYLNLGNQLLESKTQNRLQAQTITKLETQIQTLQELANQELKSQTRQNTKLQGEKEDLEDEKKDLEEILKKAGLGLNEWRLKNKKLTTAQKVGTLLVEKLRTDLTHLKSQSQTEINRLKQDKHHLQEELDLRKQTKKDLLAKNRELKKQQKEQAAKTTKQETTIQQLETEKTNWTQEKESWQKREQQLLAEIELLKNPPLTNANKENLKQTVIVKEIIREVIVKDLINEELGLKLTLQEKTKLNELPLQEAQNYRNQSKDGERERESKALNSNHQLELRERKILFWMLMIVFLVAVAEFMLLVREKKKRLKLKK